MQQKVCESVHVSLFSGLTFSEYIYARNLYCQSAHSLPCSKCEGFLSVTKLILEQGHLNLSSAFAMLTPTKRYTSEYARSLLLQMPLVSIRIGNPKKGHSFSILIEKFSGTDYSKIGSILNSLVNTIPLKETSLEKSMVKALLSIAQSDHERNCIRYAIYKASGMSQTAIQHKYGFEQMQQHAASVEEVILEIQNFRESINDLANIEEKALLLQCGVVFSESSSSSDSEEDFSVQECNMLSMAKVPLNTNPAYLKPPMVSSKYNFFDMAEETGIDTESDIDLLYEALLKVSKDPNEVQLLQESYMAYKCVHNDTCSYEQDRTARSLNGEIVSDSQSDNPECYVGITDPLSDKAKYLIVKKCTAIRRRAKRRKKKAIAERRFLSRKISKRVSKILRDCPNIGETIETFVQERNVGADAWRRTGVLTFDGNTNLKQKATYESIRQHLEEVYKCKFSFGSVIQLCMPRNKRRSSAKRYMGVARVTSQRARKGFTLKFNPDTHWSSSFYKGLNELQFVDGSNMFIVNRDDASGFRLDTLTTCKQYTTPVVQGKYILTTRTDYVNKYPSVLQTTSYNFTATSKTGEVCVGVVKAPKIHEKSPAQHAGDLEMLESTEELHSVFFNESGCPKLVDCIRIDGASDEGPSHDEV